LATKWEIPFGYDPQAADSDANGVSDGDEDLDTDGLSNLQEQTRRCDPRNRDTDGDGWVDEAEVTGGSNPLDSGSSPRLFVVTRPPVGLVLPGSLGPAGLPASLTVAYPRVSVVLPGSFGTGGFPVNITVARPPVSVVLPGSLGAAGLPDNVTIGRPPVSVRLPGSLGTMGLSNNVTVARPPLNVRFATQ
jgi:hypothetical protein